MATGKEIIISVETLSKTYRMYQHPVDSLRQLFVGKKKRFYSEHRAVKALSFEVLRGETLGIIGVNGSGKSTLLQMIAGTLTPSFGNIRTKGKVLALLELGAGFNPEFTGRENVRFYSALLGLTKEEIEARFDRIEAYANLGRFIDQPVKIYSSGMVVRLAFATMIHCEPETLIVDEALSVGDIRFQQKCLDSIRAFCKKGTAIVVSHDVRTIENLCSRVIWIHEGRILHDGKPEAVVKAYCRHLLGEQATIPHDFSKGEGARSRVTDQSYISAIPEAYKISTDFPIQIESAGFRSNEGAGMAVAGLPCEIGIILSFRQTVSKPVFRFWLKDRMSRIVCSTTTPIRIPKGFSPEPGCRLGVTITINAWPNLTDGEYTLSIAVLTGDIRDSHPSCVVEDLMLIKNHPQKIVNGLFSVLNTEMICREMS